MAKKNQYVFALQEQTAQEVAQILTKYVFAGVPQAPAAEGAAPKVSLEGTPVGKVISGVAKQAQEGAKPETIQIDYKQAFDILRWPQNESNPYAAKAANPEVFAAQYDAAMSLLRAEVKGSGPEIIAKLPGRVVVAQQDSLTGWIKADRKEATATALAKISETKEAGVTAVNRVNKINERLKELNAQNPETMTLADQEARKEEIARLTKEKGEQVQIIRNQSSSTRTAQNEHKQAVKLEEKTDSQIGKLLKQAQKRETKAEKVSLRERFKQWRADRKLAREERLAMKEATKSGIIEKPAAPVKTETQTTQQTQQVVSEQTTNALLQAANGQAPVVTEENANPELNANANATVVTEENANPELNANANATVVTEENTNPELNANANATVVTEENTNPELNANANATVVTEENANPELNANPVVKAPTQQPATAEVSTVFSGDGITPEA